MLTYSKKLKMIRMTRDGHSAYCSPSIAFHMMLNGWDIPSVSKK
jgi:hypothetical protein